MTRRLLFIFGLAVVVAGWTWPASANPLEMGGETGRPEPAAEPAGDLTEAIALPYSQILRDPKTPYQDVFRPVNMGGRLEPKIGDLHTEVSPDFFQGGVSYHLPIEARGAPTNAEIKLGRLYLDLLALSGSVLFSDNVDQEEHDRDFGTISMVTLTMLAYLQITDDLRLAINTGLVWLPYKNQFGVWGFMRDPIAGRMFYGGQGTLGQVSYDLRLGEWEIYIYDYLRGGAIYPEGSSLYLGELPPDEEDRTGRYVFQDRRVVGSPNRVNEPVDQLYDTSFYIRNTVGVTARRLLQTVTRLEIGVRHSDYWDVEDDGFDMPQSYDLAYITLNSERETLRFKPFVTYRVFRYEEDPWNQEVRGGIQGPITPNIYFLGSAGYFMSGESDDCRPVYHARLRHVINPQTMQVFNFWHEVTAPEQDLETTYWYHLHHVFGPYLYGDAYMAYSTFEDLNNNDTGTEEWRWGVHFTFDLSSRTAFRIGGWRKEEWYDNPTLGEWKRWIGVAQLRHLLGEHFEAVVTYQYQDRNSSYPDDSFYENMVVLTLTYYFGDRRGGLATSAPYQSTAPFGAFGR